MEPSEMPPKAWAVVPDFYDIDKINIEGLNSLVSKGVGNILITGKSLFSGGTPKEREDYKKITSTQLLEYTIKALKNLKEAEKEESIDNVYHAVMHNLKPDDLKKASKIKKELDEKYGEIKSALNFLRNKKKTDFLNNFQESFQLSLGKTKTITIKDQLSEIEKGVSAVAEKSVTQKQAEKSVSQEKVGEASISRKSPPTPRPGPPVPKRPPKIDVNQANASTKSQETPTPSTSRATSPKRSPPALPPRPKPQAETPTPKSPEPGRESVKSPMRAPERPASPKPPPTASPKTQAKPTQPTQQTQTPKSPSKAHPPKPSGPRPTSKT